MIRFYILLDILNLNLTNLKVLTHVVFFDGRLADESTPLREEFLLLLEIILRHNGITHMGKSSFVLSSRDHIAHPHADAGIDEIGKHSVRLVNRFLGLRHGISSNDEILVSQVMTVLHSASWHSRLPLLQHEDLVLKSSHLLVQILFFLLKFSRQLLDLSFSLAKFPFTTHLELSYLLL